MFPSDPDRRAPLDRDPRKDRAKREALRHLRRVQESEARHYAHRMAALADVATAFRDDPDREAVLETAGTARMGQQSAATALENARRLRENYPQALAMLAQGKVFVRTVEILLQVTKNASDAVQREVGRRVLAEVAEWDAADVRRRVAAVLPEVRVSWRARSSGRGTSAREPIGGSGCSRCRTAWPASAPSPTRSPRRPSPRRSTSSTGRRRSSTDGTA